MRTKKKRGRRILDGRETVLNHKSKKLRTIFPLKRLSKIFKLLNKKVKKIQHRRLSKKTKST
tara:strand:+ start:75 stop:260 length:186 start_codon:yes stop_codon:yes gene_type:complete